MQRPHFAVVIALLLAVHAGAVHANCTIYVSNNGDADAPFWSLSGGSDDKMLFREAIEVAQGDARCYTSFEMARIEGGNFVHDPVFCGSVDNSRNWRLSFSNPGCGPNDADTIRFWDDIQGGTQITLSEGFVQVDPRDSIDGGPVVAGARANIALHGAATCPLAQSGALVMGDSLNPVDATGTISNLYIDGFCGYGLWAPRTNGFRVWNVGFSSISGNAFGGGTALLLGQLAGDFDTNLKCVFGAQVGGSNPGQQNYFYDIAGIAISLWDTCTGDLSNRNNKIFNNYVGQCEALDTGVGLEGCPDGTPNQAIGGYGIYIRDTNDTQVGGPGANEGNYIARAGLAGVEITGSNSHGIRVRGNRIGVARQGDFARPNGTGVRIDAGADSNVVGGTGAGESNTISSNNSRGVTIADPGSSSNRISGNVIGLNTARTQTRPNGDGIGLVNAPDGVQVDHNVVAGNSAWGIYVESGSGHRIDDNIVGLRGGANNTNDNTAAANANGGIWINNTGGHTVGPGNRIAGNNGAGVLISGDNADANVIAGNTIGLDNGNGARGNAGAGVLILDGADNTVVGGDTAAARNIISGNLDAGIYASGSGTDGTIVRYNYVGTDSSGNAARPNGVEGIRIAQGASQSLVRQNLVSGNLNDGIKLDSGASGNRLEVNQVGYSNAILPLPNGASGISVLSGAHDNMIGDLADPFMLNLIAGNAGAGIFVADAGTTHNAIGQNLIGSAGVANGSGIVVTAGATATTIYGNIIEANNGSGIAIVGSTTLGNALIDNLISGNAALGIDLGGDGVSANDANDADSGPDNLQNFPTLDNVVVATDSATLRANLSSHANQAYTVTLYRSDHCDASGYGEGQVKLGAATLNTGANGNGSLAGLLVAIPEGPTTPSWASATAMSASGDTSEFGPCASLSDLIFSNGFDAPAAQVLDSGLDIDAWVSARVDGTSSVSVNVTNTSGRTLPAQRIGMTTSAAVVVSELDSRCALAGRIECRVAALASGQTVTMRLQLTALERGPIALNIVSEVRSATLARKTIDLPTAIEQ